MKILLKTCVASLDAVYAAGRVLTVGKDIAPEQADEFLKANFADLVESAAPDSHAKGKKA